MTAFEASQKTQRTVESFEARVLKVGMLVPLLFWAWTTYHFVQWAWQGLISLIPWIAGCQVPQHTTIVT